MPRIALNAQQRREHKVISLKGWVVAQMKLTGKHQADVADEIVPICNAAGIGIESLFSKTERG